MNLLNVNVKKNINIIFMGTPEFSVPVLSELAKNYKVKAVVTQPDRMKSRGKTIPTPVKQKANELTILTLQPNKIKESIEQILELEPDLIVTCAYGQKVPDEILNYPKYGCINVHASLLPKYRGGAPIHRAIMNGDSKTGITIMHMASEMDAGDIIEKRELAISEEETTSHLHDRLKILGSELLIETLPRILDGSAQRIPQNIEEVTYAPIIKKTDEKIDFTKTKKEIKNKVRGLNQYPGAYAFFENKVLKIYKVRYGTNNYSNLLDGEITGIYDDGFGVKVANGEIVIQEVKPEGKRMMSALSFANGQKDLIGKVLL